MDKELISPCCHPIEHSTVNTPVNSQFKKVAQKLAKLQNISTIHLNRRLSSSPSTFPVEDSVAISHSIILKNKLTWEEVLLSPQNKNFPAGYYFKPSHSEKV